MLRSPRLALPLVLAAAAGVPASAHAADVVPGEVIVRYEPGAGAAQRADARRDAGATSAEALPLRMEALSLRRGASVSAAIAGLAARDDVQFAQPNHRYRPAALPNDPLFATHQWSLHNTGQTGGTADADVDAPEAWDVGTGSDSVVIGIVDTGVNVRHPDLAANVDPRGRDFFGTDDAVVDDDYAEHGTFVASVAAARGNNGLGMSGVAQNARILPLQAGDAGFVDTQSVVEAVAYARAAGARVVNMSFGSFGLQDGGDAAIQTSIEQSPEILFTTSAGNTHPDTGLPNDNDASPHWPSNLSRDHANVISVASTDDADALSGFSSFGATTVDLAAPGETVLGAAAMTPLDEQSFDSTAAPALPAGWTATGGWATTVERRRSLPNSLTDSPGADYAANTDSTATSPAFTVPSPATSCALVYRLRRRLAAGDAIRAEVSLGGAAFQTVDAATGSSPGTGFEERVAGTPVTEGQPIVYRFRLVTDGADEAGGVHVDDVRLACNQPSARFATGSGTSFSSPAVAGAAAVLLGRRPDLSAGQLKALLKETVDVRASLVGRTATGGRLNLDRAVRAAAEVPPAAGPPTPPGPATTPGATVPGTTSVAPPRVAVRDTTRPVLRSASVSPFAFLPLRAGGLVRATATRRGSRLRFGVSERSRVRVRVLRALAGRRAAGGACVPPTRANRARARCARYVQTGRVGAVPGTVNGFVSRRFTGRVGGRALAPGAYRVELRATDAAGNRSAPRSTGFRIVRR